ncbi:aconitate hydratase AcnA [Ktedonosporobacter rubrisoli]|uniref:Aconitate hydratase n=1 Tax=Ktedonosporobacter rubrisoli TaxID=2509675 RepID=A0A4P6JNH0_KTERU|nr:aconitate hydratase AcnA [Ktedonosporobacter rubrisoli]QBD76785.1 aconitate hydratase AcnA [Ktedonosporobacter rubrisoli]
MKPESHLWDARAQLTSGTHQLVYYRLQALEDAGLLSLHRLPYTVKVLLENVLRQADQGGLVSEADVQSLASWQPGQAQHTQAEYPFFPTRVLLPDLSGIPAVADLAAMRAAIVRKGGDPRLVNPLVPADFIIDHSVQVDQFGTSKALMANMAREYERNRERYAFLRWAQKAFDNFRVVPPGQGILHQVNLEYLATVVATRQIAGELVAMPDTLVGADSHTPMINGLGVLGWGVGGIEAEAVMLGLPIYLLTPEVIGIRVIGNLPEGTTATDVVLTVTQLLRQQKVVGKFIEFTGPGLKHLALADRATIANMSPEFGATSTIFPVDAETLRYLRITGRSAEQVELVERYTREQRMFWTDETPEPAFDALLELDLSSIEPSVAGPRRPQDRVALWAVGRTLRSNFAERFPAEGAVKEVPLEYQGQHIPVRDGSIAIAAITSCTNTSNPAVMIAAGLLAKKAVQRGLQVKPTIKTSLAPGSRVVREYLERSGLLAYLEALRFHVVGFGCTTCIGGSGPLVEPLAEAVQHHDLLVTAVLSGNRNFEGRVHQQVKASFLASPPLVVAYALAGTMDIDLTQEPLGTDKQGLPVYLRDLWPSQDEVQQIVEQVISAEVFKKGYANVFAGDEQWRALPVTESVLFDWDPDSTYIQEPPFCQDQAPLADIMGARALVVLDDSVTTDHISPAGSFAAESPAGQYLQARGVSRRDLNTYGARRANHEVMIRGTFGNIRLRNHLAEGHEGYYTRCHLDGMLCTIAEAAERYRTARIPLLVIAGKEYGCGSSRDWAAKGPALLGVRAVLAESFERIHRSNLVGMGILPLQFLEGESKESLGLTGQEVYHITCLTSGLKPRQLIEVQVEREDGTRFSFQTIACLNSQVEVAYYENGGILPTVLYKLLHKD